MKAKETLIKIKNILLNLNEQRNLIIYNKPVDNINLTTDKEESIEKTSAFDNPKVIKALLQGALDEDEYDEETGVYRLFSDFGEIYYDIESKSRMYLLRCNEDSGCVFETKNDKGYDVLKFNLNGDPVSYDVFMSVFQGRMKEVRLNSIK